MIPIIEEIKDLIFGNKRLEAYQHFAAKKEFQFS